jgi:tetratricopeptide (TPR) repeat protein
MPYNQSMKRIWLALMFAPAIAFAQSPAEVQKLFEAGKFQQVVETTQADADPAARFVVAQSHQRLGASDEARRVYEELAGRPDNDAWHFIGMSARLLLDDDSGGALDSAQRAVEIDGNSADAQFQLGLARAKRQEWREAAAAFDRAAELRPGFAYAHYNGGLTHYRANRPDRMANHFEQFLKLAPEAPERPEVIQIMRTVRGR